MEKNMSQRASKGNLIHYIVHWIMHEGDKTTMGNTQNNSDDIDISGGGNKSVSQQFLCACRYIIILSSTIRQSLTLIFSQFYRKMKLIVLASAVVGAAAFAPNSVSRQGTSLNMAAKLKPKLQYVPCISADDIPEVGRATSGVAGGLAICIANDGGKLWALGDKCPPINQPLSFGKVEDGCICDPVLGTKFNLKTGQVADGDWCCSPIGKIVGGLFESGGVPTYSCKANKNVVEVQVDVNYKANYESDYWAGLLDAQGKSNGKYY